MGKDVSIDKDGTVTLRANGTPETGGNINNFIQGSLTPENLRLGVEGGVGLTGTHDFGPGLKLIGSTGVSASLSGNLHGSKHAQWQPQKTDMPVRNNAMGIGEVQQAMHEIMNMTGGDLRKATVADVQKFMAEHPNGFKPEVRENFNRAITKLNGANYNPTHDVQEAQAAIAKLHDRWQQNGGTQGAYDNLQDALAKNHVDVALSPGAQAIAQGMLNKAGGQIDKLYAESQNPPAALLKNYSAADIVMPMTLEQVDAAAARVQGVIAHTDTQATLNQVNGYLALAGKPMLDPSTLGKAQNVLNDVSSTTAHAVEDYSRIPSIGEVRHMNDMVDKLVQIRPEAALKEWAALGALTPNGNAAVVAERTQSFNAGDFDYVAGTGAKLHMGNERTLRGELGWGDPAASFSRPTADKLNLDLSTTEPQSGSHVFISQGSEHWNGLEGVSRHTTSIGMGGTASTPMGNDKVRYVSFEVAQSHIDDSGPGISPGRKKDKSAVINVGIKF